MPEPHPPLHFEIFGTNGPEVAFLHGFCETSKIWKPWIDRFPEYRVILIDLPGFGRSFLPEGHHTLEHVAFDVLHLFRKQGWRPVVVGHSLGGYVALAMAELEPKLLSGLVLFHSTPFADPADRKAGRDKAIAFVREHGVQAFTGSLIPNLFFKKDQVGVNQAREIAAQTPKQTVVKYLAAMRDRPDRSEVFAGFSGKKAIIAGKDDTLVLVDTMRNWVKTQPQVVLFEMNNAGHMGMFEAPVDTADALKKIMG